MKLKREFNTDIRLYFVKYSPKTGRISLANLQIVSVKTFFSGLINRRGAGDSSLYDRYSDDGLKKKPKLNPTPDFKEKVVRLILKKGIPLSHVLIDYRISRTALKQWVRLAHTKGYMALHESKRRGRPLKDMGRPKKKEPQTELEKLQAENLRLRAENALLKKVKVLVEEKQARARLNGQKPSTN